MFYLPFSLREITERTTPKGPNFNKAKRVSVNLSGNLLSLKIPRHKARSPSDHAVHFKGLIDVYDQRLYHEFNPIGEWKISLVLHRTWHFNGPMFSGKLADIHFGVSIFQRPLDKNNSLFNPIFFEDAVKNILTERYADKKFRWKSSWCSPVNWQSQTHLPVHACSFDSVPVTSSSALITNACLPLTHDCLINIHFRQNQAMSGSLKKRDALIDRSTMEQLSRDVIASIQLELSPESQQQLDDAKARYPNETLSEHVAPLKWTTPEEDAKHAQVLIDNAEFAATMRKYNKDPNF